jgi:hypothetical protein
MFRIFVSLDLRKRFWQISAGSKRKRREQDMQVGKPLRTVVVEPLELPVKPSADEPESEPILLPQPEPDGVPVTP